MRRSDGSLTIGMTNGLTHTVYIDDTLRGYMLDKVIGHELVHCFMFSYDININIDLEEFIADWVATYGRDLIYLLDNIIRELKGAGGS